jgi:predicted amidohydrolase
MSKNSESTRRQFMKDSAVVAGAGLLMPGALSPGEAKPGRSASADGLHFHQSGFAPNPEGWSAWSVRAETAPRTFVDQAVSCGKAGSLAVSGDGNIAAFGGWQRTLTGIKEGAWYRFVAHYRAVGVTSENWQIVPDLYWQKPDGKQIGNDDRVDYAARSVRKGLWTEVSLEVPAPAGATYVVLELFLAHAAMGIVWWDNISFDEIPAPQPRKVTIATINLKPSNTGTAAESVRQFIEAGERLAPAHTDLILLPEGISVVGTDASGLTCGEVAEPVPGPTTAFLGELARAKHAYVAAGLYERERGAAYNTAVLIDREGKLVGRYRKVFLPRGEMVQLTPGNEFPVFRTDFGTVGMMICYDVYYTEPARQLAQRGAEIILLPIWGGDEVLATARAIENQVFLVTSGYDHPTYIMDHDGKRIAQAPQRGTAAVATIDLNAPNFYQGITDWKDRRLREYRAEVVKDFLYSGGKTE